MQVGSLVRVNHIYAKEVDSSALGLLGVVVSMDTGDEEFCIGVKMFHNAKTWTFTPEELDTMEEQADEEG